jgi:arsenite-transporting ATPase
VLLTRRISFLGGKGGVGKTTIAASAALSVADAGQRTLLVSTDPAHSTSDVLQMQLGSDVRPVTRNLYALELDPEREAELYISDVKDRLAEAIPPRLVDEVERQIDVAKVSPGAAEAALFERFARVLDGSADYDRVIFDTAPTGQTLRLLGLPETMNIWMSGLIQRRRKVSALGKMWRNVAGASAGGDSGETQVGSAGNRGGTADADAVLTALEQRRDRFVRARALLTDDAQTSFLFVLTPQRLPILETARAVSTLRKYDIPVGGVIVNQVEPAADSGPGAPMRTVRKNEFLETIETEFAEIPRWLVPRMEEEVVGLAALRELGGMMKAESTP